MSGLLDLLFPEACPVCDRLHAMHITDGAKDAPGLCGDCLKKVKRIKAPVCLHCGKPLINSEEPSSLCMDCEEKKDTSFDQGRAVFLYEGEMTLSMYRMKYSKKRSYAKSYAIEAVETLGEWIEKIKPEVIIPVPLHEKRQRERGYNQAEDFANELSKLVNIPVDNSILKRVKNTAPQKELDNKNRSGNIKNAFHTAPKDVEYNRVLLVDDIYTTGSTVSAAADSIKKSGVGAVYVLCICIGTGD